MRRGLAAACSLVLLAGCASDARGESGDLTVLAASSLADVLPRIAPDESYSFAGSDELALQIREGAPADVFAPASGSYTDILAAEGLLEEPVVFATNRLVLIVPNENPRNLLSVDDLAQRDLRLVIGAKGVPAGDYARTALHDLDLEEALDNVVSEEENVRAVVTKVALGEADAGIAYATDVRAAAGDVRALNIPASAQPRIEYAIAVVAGSDDPEAARAFVAKVMSSRGLGLLADAGFGPP